MGAKHTKFALLLYNHILMRKRGGADGMQFHNELEGALGRFNRWMTDEAIRCAVERLEALPSTIWGCG